MDTMAPAFPYPLYLIGGDASMANIIPVATIADLQAYNLTNLLEDQLFYVTSFNAAVNGVTDGGGGFFLLTYHAPAGSAGTPTGVNSFTIFTSNTAGAYFYRQFQGPYLLEWTGLDQTGATDAAPSVQAAINATPDGATLTTYRIPTLKIGSTITINNRTALTFSAACNPGGGGTMPKMVWAGALGAIFINLLNSGHCVIEGWTMTLGSGNGCGIGVNIGTDGTATRISTQNTLRRMNLNMGNPWNASVTNFIAVSLGATQGTNNEFMTFDTVDCEGGGTGATITNYLATGFYLGGNSNNHYHSLRNCTANGMKIGIDCPIGGVRTEGGFIDLTSCQIAVQTNPTYPVTLSNLDSETTWTILKLSGAGQAGVRLIGARVAGCGAVGKALFDFTTNCPQRLVVQNCNFDVAGIPGGGFFMDVTGTGGGAGSAIFRDNWYGSGTPTITLNGFDPNGGDIGGGFLIVADRDQILGTGGQDVAIAPNSSSEKITQVGQLALRQAIATTSFTSGAFVLPQGASGITVASNDASTLVTITIPAGSPQNPFIMLTASGTVNIGTAGNISYSGTLTTGQMILLYFNGSKWVKSV